METVEKNKMEIFRQHLLMFAKKTKKLVKTHIPVPEKIEGFGTLEFDVEKCWGCAACKVQCLGGALQVVEDEDKRIITLDYWKCIACGECEESCPKEAIKIHKIFNLKDFLSDEPIICVQVEITRCPRCGKIISPNPVLKEVTEKFNVIETPQNLKNFSNLCDECRSKLIINALIKSRGMKP